MFDFLKKWWTKEKVDSNLQNDLDDLIDGFLDVAINHTTKFAEIFFHRKTMAPANVHQKGEVMLIVASAIDLEISKSFSRIYPVLNRKFIERLELEFVDLGAKPSTDCCFDDFAKARFSFYTKQMSDTSSTKELLKVAYLIYQKPLIQLDEIDIKNTEIDFLISRADYLPRPYNYMIEKTKEMIAASHSFIDIVNSKYPKSEI
jgi:hypothetical protein